MPDARAVTALKPACAPPAGARIGIDLVHVARIAESVEAFGDRFTQRLFAAGELRDCTVAGRLDATRLALRFAAKEAAIKAFDLSEAGIGWSQIEMTECAGDGARIRLHGRAADSAARWGTYEIAVRSAQADGMACAIVVALPGDRTLADLSAQADGMACAIVVALPSDRADSTTPHGVAGHEPADAATQEIRREDHHD